MVNFSLLLGSSLLALVAVGYGYYIHAPFPPKSRLSTTPRAGTIQVGDRTRSYQVYVPAQLPPHAPLVLVLHGSNLDGRTMRQWTGYEFDKLADRYGFAVAYPDGYKGNWNDCRRDAPFPAKVENIDDMGFLRALVAHCHQAHSTDSGRVFAFGYSNGGQMAFRLAIEQPQLVAAIATAGANLPTPATCSCATEGPTARVLLVAGTADPISPYAGGRVTLFGFGNRGTNLSAKVTAEAFARRNGVTTAPVVTMLPPARATAQPEVEEQRWGPVNRPAVLFYTVHKGGHVVPQRAFRFPRLLGSTTKALDMPSAAIAFFGLDDKAE